MLVTHGIIPHNPSALPKPWLWFRCWSKFPDSNAMNDLETMHGMGIPVDRPREPRSRFCIGMMIDGDVEERFGIRFVSVVFGTCRRIWIGMAIAIGGRWWGWRRRFLGFFGIIGGNGFDAPLLSASASVSAFGCFILPILLLLIERPLQIGERARRLVVGKGEE